MGGIGAFNFPDMGWSFDEDSTASTESLLLSVNQSIWTGMHQINKTSQNTPEFDFSERVAHAYNESCAVYARKSGAFKLKTPRDWRGSGRPAFDATAVREAGFRRPSGL